jgi:Na+-transporting NADH:ubiquinone oxidoreductase subunit NqrE
MIFNSLKCAYYLNLGPYLPFCASFTVQGGSLKCVMVQKHYNFFPLKIFQVVKFWWVFSIYPVRNNSGWNNVKTQELMRRQKRTLV